MTQDVATNPAPADIEPKLAPSRRGVLGVLTGLLAGAWALVLAIPGVGYLLSPLIRKKEEQGGYVPLTRFADLEVGVPKAFPVIEARRDAWVQYPPEPVGSVWLVRQPEGSERPVVAFTAECPHLACAINLSDDGRGFFCPCHVSSFDIQGKRQGGAAPRDMDPLDVEGFNPTDPEAVVRVRFRRFQTMTEERIPLA